MWAIDRTNLIILGVALGIIAMVGVVLMLAPPSSPESTPVTAAHNESVPVSDTLPPETEQESESDTQPVSPDAVTEPSAPEPVLVAPPIASAEYAVDGIIQSGEYKHATEAGGFRVYWDNDSVVLRIGLFSQGTGYVAIGLDPEYRMRGANFIMGTVRNGQTILRDDYGVGSLTHGSDLDQGGSDDILVAAGRELNGQTTIEFVIPLDSGDRYDKPLQPGGTYDILVAFHNTSDNFSTRHSQRGSGEIRLDDAP